MKTSTHCITNANQAVAQIAYKTNEVFPIYPITPASEMSELVEQWHAENKPNGFGNIPSVFQMQSEAGVAGAMHGALQMGGLSSTFTASQGLLLMLPNMYKIAAELTPNVIHVATRSVATHALSVFGDHSDVMAVRQSGYAFMASASVQEAQDFALIAQAATLASRIPFVHFFDGFRTSHEISKIETLSDDIIKQMINTGSIKAHQERALSPNKPVLRGSSQSSDVFFQSREAVNSFYKACPDIVQNKMDIFAKLSGRSYKLFDYVGHEEAEYLIVSMASSTATIESTIKHLNKKGAKYGLIKVRLFRPFSTKHLISALPKTVKHIAVLDRTKEPGATGEPLYLDVVQSVSEAFQNKKIKNLPKIIGGRYGLSSKEFTPSMVNAIFTSLKTNMPKSNFTIGINDDVTHLSLDYSERVQIEKKSYQAIFYHEKNKTQANSFTQILKRVGAKESTYVQGYVDCDYKKSNSYNIAHLRIGYDPINAPYLIDQADFVGYQNVRFLHDGNMLDNLKPGGILLVGTALKPQEFWQSLSAETQLKIVEKNANLHIIDLEEQHQYNAEISGFHACFMALNKRFSDNETINGLPQYIYSVDTSNSKKDLIPPDFDTTFSNSLLGKLLAKKGNDIPVNLLPVDGTYPTNTSIFNPAQNNDYLPDWDTGLCTQCGACSMACPQAALRIKVYGDAYLNNAPKTFKHIISEDFDLMNYTVQIHPDQCNGCSNCVDACPVKALKMTRKEHIVKHETQNWDYFKTIPEFDRTRINVLKVSEQQLQEPLFKYSNGVEGCGEAPYLKLISQLFGDRLLVANATGASSIFGGALPTTPWAKNAKGKGPAWSNSLFEDNAEFGLGYRMSINQQERTARDLLEKLLPKLGFDLVHDIMNANQNTEAGINAQRSRIDLLKKDLGTLGVPEAKQLLPLADQLVKRSIWIVGGDGWAYDIGFGGLDHVLASGENVNILVLDNEVYDNTGAQASKSTPFGASAKFAYKGKQKQKKDLGRWAMGYKNVYVASVAIGADQQQTLRAFNEAETYDGPSIIIAYCHSDSHGIDMKHPNRYHKAAVDSGQWLLYRNDPRKEQAFQLDSAKPSIKIETYLNLEKRFSKFIDENKIQANERIGKIQKQIDWRYERFLLKSFNQKVNRTKLIHNAKIRNIMANIQR